MLEIVDAGYVRCADAMTTMWREHCEQRDQGQRNDRDTHHQFHKRPLLRGLDFSHGLAWLRHREAVGGKASLRQRGAQGWNAETLN